MSAAEVDAVLALKATATSPLLEEQPPSKKMKVDATTTAGIATMAKRAVLRFAKMSDQAFEPVKGSARAAGFDLRSAYDVTVPPRGKALVKTDLQVQVPEGSYGRVAPRSGLAVKNFIDVGAGVVDEDYRGNLGVVLFNHADVEFEVKRGDRIAQFICERIFYPELEQVDKLEETDRGAAGFGSTGVKEVLETNGSASKTANGNGSTPMATDDENGKAANGDEAKAKASPAKAAPEPVATN